LPFYWGLFWITLLGKGGLRCELDVFRNSLQGPRGLSPGSVYVQNGVEPTDDSYIKEEKRGCISPFPSMN
jgi:hypothetical protein